MVKSTIARIDAEVQTPANRYKNSAKIPYPRLRIPLEFDVNTNTRSQAHMQKSTDLLSVSDVGNSSVVQCVLSVNNFCLLPKGNFWI